METHELAIPMIGCLLDIPIQIYEENPQQMGRYASTLCLWPALQPMFSESSLRLFASEAKGYRIYEIQDLFGIRLLLFKWNNTPVFAGPYVEEPWDETAAESVLRKQQVPLSHLVQYKLYYCAFRAVRSQDAVHVVKTILEVLAPEEKGYRHQVLHGLRDGEAPPEAEELLDFSLAVQRYKQENKFMKMVQEGNFQGAMETMRGLQEMKEMNLFYISTGNFLTSVSIIRTLTRKAAESSGLHPAVVDAISQAYAQKAYTVRTAEERSNLTRDMIAEYCNAIQTMREDNYSSAVRSAAAYIRLHLSMPMTLADIAAAAGIAPNYLSHLFKAETGMPVLKYVAMLRCQEAADLLRTTSMSVQEISMRAGYLDNNYFVKVFKSNYGMTPTEYRNKLA